MYRKIQFPIFNKKEEILSSLCEFNIPLYRAVWFIKMTANYYTNQDNRNQNRTNRRQNSDPCSGRSRLVFARARICSVEICTFFFRMDAEFAQLSARDSPETDRVLFAQCCACTCEHRCGCAETMAVLLATSFLHVQCTHPK